MENKTKTWQIVLGILILIALGILIATLPAKEPTVPTDNEVGENVWEDPNVTATQLCFIWNTEAGDKAQISMDIRGNQVIGEFNWVPAEKDSKTGIFEGTISDVDPKMMARTVHALWEASAEGATVMEELKIIVGEGTASPGFGEMRDRGDGVYVYADPDNLSYAPNLSDTDCGDEAMD